MHHGSRAQLRGRERYGVRAGHPAQEKAEEEQNHLHWRPVGRTGEGVPEDPVPRRLHQRRASTKVCTHLNDDLFMFTAMVGKYTDAIVSYL